MALLLMANPAAERILGLSVEQMQGRKSVDPRWRAIHEDGSDFPGEQHPASVALRTGKAVHGVVMGVYHPQEEAYGWILIDAIPEFRGGETRPYRVYATFSEITERVRAAAQLAQKTRLYATLSQINQMIVRVKEPTELYQAICDVAVKFGEFSLAWVGLLDEASGEVRPVAVNGLDLAQWPFQIVNIHKGASRGRLAATAIRTSKVVTSEDIAVDKRTRCMHEQFVKFGYHSSAAIPFRLKGRVIGVLSLNSRQEGFFKDEEEVHLLDEMGVDISFALEMMETEAEHKRAEEALRTLTERLGLATRSAQIGIWDWDNRENQLVWDDQMYKLYGVKKEEFPVDYDAWLNGVHPDDRDLSNEIFQQALHGEKKYDTEFRVLWPDGCVHWLRANAQVFRDENGQAIRMVGVNYDITERKRAEEALREREQKLKTLLNFLPVGISILDHERKVVYSNDTLGKILEITKEGLLRGDYRSRKYLRADGSEKTTEEFASTRVFTECTELHDIVTGVVKEDGHTVWTSISAAPVDFPDWKVILVTADITERKRAEEALRQKENQYHTLFDKATDGIFIVDAAGNYTDANPAGLQMLGYDHDELIGLNVVDVAIPVETSSLDPEKEYVQEQSQNAKPMPQQWHFKRKDGSTFIGELSSGLMPDGRVLGVLRDIDERKRAEEDLRASKKLLQDVIDNTAALVYILDLEGRFMLVNHKIETLFGFTNEQILGQTRNAFMPIEFALKHRSNDLEIIQTGQGKLFEEENLEPDGRHVYLTNKFPLFDTHNQVYAICGISTDMTERKRMEEELHRSNTELEQFAYVASHDLQEPLRAVAGMVQLLGQRYQGQLDERADEYIGHAVEASQHMQNLINDLLDYSRVGRLGKPFEPTAVESSLKMALANLQTSVQENQAQITHDPLPTVLADPGQLSRVLQNLIGNALKFRGDNPPRIHIGAEKVEGAWCISVSDNGIGIEPQYFERIFLVFQRLHTRREYAGTGIGLALCKKIIERHGGQIWVESQPGQGSTFFFTLPERKL